MKDKFFAPVNLMQLEETLKEQKPYAILTVSTTGLDNKDFTEHAPIRVNMTQFEFNPEIKQYVTGFAFDKMVQAPQAAIEAAIKGAESYDVFVNGGINKEAYLKGEGVLSAEEFKKEFDLAVTAVKQSNATLIVNGGESFATQYLGKVNCGEQIAELGKSGKLLDQTRITQEYFQKQNINENATLENLRNTMLPSPKLSFVGDAEKMRDFKGLSKERFLESYSYLSEKEYDITAKDKENRDKKIIGGDNRIKVIDAFVTKYGREVNALEAEWQSHMRESDKAYIEDLSKKGKKEYEEKPFSQKFAFFIDKGIINPDEIKERKGEFQKVIDTLEGKKDCKGIIIAHASSTGFERGIGSPQNTGFPTQFTALAYEMKDGKVDLSHNKAVNLTIGAPAKSILKAEERAKTGYDAFAAAGIDLKEYKEGKDVCSPSKAVGRIHEFFKFFPTDKYALVTLDSAGSDGKSFTQTCMQNLANFPMCSAEYIDMSKVIKEYAFLTCHEHDTEYNGKNVLFNEDEMTDQKFSLEAIAKANKIDSLQGASRKCLFVANMLKSLEKQQQEMFRPEELVTEQEEAVKQDVEKAPAPVAEEEEAFIEEGYDNVVVEKSERDETEEERRLEREALNEAVAENIDAITAGMSSGIGLVRRGAKEDVHKEEAEASKSVGFGAFRQQMNRNAENNTASSRVRNERPAPAASETNNVRQIDEARKGGFTRTAQSDEDRAKLRRNPQRTNTTERTPVQSAPAETVDTNRLLEIITSQNATIAQQSAIIARQNEKLFDVLQQQNEVMKGFVERIAELQTPSREETQLPKQLNSENVISFMETIKKQIGELKEQLPAGNKAAKHLTDANKSLSEGQRELEQTEKKERVS